MGRLTLRARPSYATARPARVGPGPKERTTAACWMRCGTTHWDWPNGIWSAAFYIARITSIPGGRSSGSNEPNWLNGCLTIRKVSSAKSHALDCPTSSNLDGPFSSLHTDSGTVSSALAGARARRRLAAAGAGSGTLALAACQAGAHLCRLCCEHAERTNNR